MAGHAAGGIKPTADAVAVECVTRDKRRRSSGSVATGRGRGMQLARWHVLKEAFLVLKLIRRPIETNLFF